MHTGTNVSVTTSHGTRRDDRPTRTPVVTLAALMALVLACTILPACNTTKGVGEDVEAAGEGLQNAAEGAKDAIDN